MKKTVLRPKKEKQQGQINVININIQNKSTKEGYLDSDLEEPDNKKIYNNVITRIENKELESFKNIELKPQNKNKYVFKTERSNRYKDMNKEEKGENVYELFSIVIQSGSADGGHYYAYIKSFEDDKWYKFNDGSVTLIDKKIISDIFGEKFENKINKYHSSATAYYLSYRKMNNPNDKMNSI